MALKSKLIRANRALAVECMVEKLLQETDEERRDYAEILKNWLRSNPETLLLLQIWQWDSEDYAKVEELVGYVIAYTSPKSKHVFINQTWFSNKCPDNLRKKAFARLVFWAEEHERYELRMETKRNPEAFYRRWGFVPFSTIMAYQIPTELNVDSIFNVLDDKGEILDKEVEDIENKEEKDV